MLRTLIAAIGLVWAVAAHANDEAIRMAVEAMLGSEVKVEGVTKAGFLGLYEIRLTTEEGTKIIYTDEAATYFFIGNIVDNKTQTDITEARLRKLNAIRFADLPLPQAFKIVRGKGTRQLAYFSDPRCPYCRRLDQEIAKLDDVTVHV